MTYPRMYPKDREITKEIASWLLTRIPVNEGEGTVQPTPRSLPRRRAIPLHESHKRYTLCFLLFVLVICFLSTWAVGTYSECGGNPPIATPPYVSDWDGITRTLNEQVTYYCVNATGAPIREVYVCGRTRTWCQYKNNSCDCPAHTIVPRNPHLVATLNGTMAIGSIVNYYCQHKTNRTLVKYGTAVCNISRKWEIVRNDTSLCKL